MVKYVMCGSGRLKGTMAKPAYGHGVWNIMRMGGSSIFLRGSA